MKTLLQVAVTVNIIFHQIENYDSQTLTKLGLPAYITTDFAAHGEKQFLIIVDCKTGWLDVIKMGHDTTAVKELTEALGISFIT